jgi:5-formyltetrahydrofolate cyclo-ligase
MLYVAVRGEVETGASIKACLEVGKRTFIPWCDPSSKKIRAAEITDYEADLVASTYGIPAPPEERLNFAPAREVELFIVPGIGFDWAGARLGWGKGYYDLFLSSADPDAVKIALAYEFQLLPHIEQVSHDVLMGKVITENRVIDCRKVRDNIARVRKYQ